MNKRRLIRMSRLEKYSDIIPEEQPNFEAKVLHDAVHKIPKKGSEE